MTKRSVVLAWVLLGGLAAPGTADVFISEFMAVNNTTLQDEDGAYPDWLELFNAGSQSVDLEGWFLTDSALNLYKWRFPAVSIAPGQFLVVFCSGKDRTDPAAELHTSFRLRGDGEYLALVGPDGLTVVHAYEGFPEQVADVSYGLSQEVSSSVLIGPSAPARVLVPTDGALGTAWTQTAFNDSAWISGTTGAGYDLQPDYRHLIAIDTQALMYGINSTAYIRVPFTVDDPGEFNALTLRMKYDDGFAAFINGQVVAERNAPSPLAWNSDATGLNDDAAALVFEDMPVLDGNVALQAGMNVLAIHGLNERTTSSDFLIMPELVGVTAGAIDTAQSVYLPVPTPGAPNGNGYPAVAGRPEFSHAEGVYNSDIELSITAPSPGALIRYTLDRSFPTTASPLYAAPLTINQNRMVRVRVFQAGAVPSPVETRAYTILDANVRTFSSNLPIFVVNTYGQGIAQGGYTRGYLQVMDTSWDRASLTGQKDFSGLVGMKIRGSSSAGFPKKMYKVETWDEFDNDRDVSVLGFPAESDWVLNGPYSDKSLMRNVLSYGWSNEIGRDAVRTQFVEMFLRTSAGRLNTSDYVGVYVFMEKIKRGEDRVNVERLYPSQNSQPEITGGYVMKIDRLGPGESGLRTSRGTLIAMVDPREARLTSAQRQYLLGYMNAFESTLFSTSFADPENGYAKYIDVDSWVDHFLLTELMKNIDGYRLSTFFYKDRGGKLVMEPIWDYNLSLGNANYLDGWLTTGWYLNLVGDNSAGWWKRLLQDREFEQKVIDRWAQISRRELTVASMHATVEARAALLGEAQARNFTRWNILGQYVWPNWYVAATWRQEIDWMRGWISGRWNWITSLYLGAPVFSREGGLVPPYGTEISLTAPRGVIYYTLDGSDPRLRGGGISPSAIEYTGPIEVRGNVKIRARARQQQTLWSGVIDETYVTDPPSVVVTEIMYHPRNPPAPDVTKKGEFEFIELMNVGAQPEDLSGARFVRGIRFTFSEGSVLMPGEHFLVVKNREAFAARYGSQGFAIAGEFDGQLDNGGETIALLGPVDEVIAEFRYDDAWYPETDGSGFSLVIRDPWDAPTRWGVKDAWRVSADIDGSPGRVDPGTPPSGGMQLPGDANQDGRLDVSDVFGILRLLFAGAALPLPCGGSSLNAGGNLTLLDVNDDGAVNVADAVYLLHYLFGDGPPPVLGTACIRIEGCWHACGL